MNGVIMNHGQQANDTRKKKRCYIRCFLTFLVFLVVHLDSPINLNVNATCICFILLRFNVHHTVPFICVVEKHQNHTLAGEWRHNRSNKIIPSMDNNNNHNNIVFVRHTKMRMYLSAICIQ